MKQYLAAFRETSVRETAKLASQRPSTFQKQVLKSCNSLDPSWQVLGGEHLTEDKLFSMDVAMLVQGVKVAVEADGPTHFSMNKPYRLMGSTLLRNRALQRRGWRLLSVPFYEWDELPSAKAKAEYLRSKLIQLCGQSAAAA